MARASFSALVMVLLGVGPLWSEPAGVTFTRPPGGVEIRIGGQVVGTYTYEDAKIARPFLCSLRTLDGLPVTRNHPPVPGKDLVDHDAMHPGIWLAFGDINGQDFWRNKARVVHEKFLREPAGREGQGTFTVLNRYVAADGKTVLAREECRVAVALQPPGWLLRWESTFRPEAMNLVFGDQEEMGFGVRLATPLTVKQGGVMRDSEGRKNQAGVWGRTADWCDYSGEFQGRRVGLTLMPGPGNFRPSWFHARDYGLLVANPFGRYAFTKGAKSQVTVRTGDKLTLRFGVFLYAVAPGETPDLPAVYRSYLRAEGANGA